MRLKEKIAIVTGGGSGIGRAISLLFAQKGAKVVVVGRRMQMLESVVNEIRQLGGEAMTYRGDISNQNEVNSMVKTVVDVYGGLDVLVNNAGVYISHDALGASEDEWNQMLNVDLKGVWLCSKAVLPYMLKSKSGKIINIASIAGLIGFEKSAAYCAAKGGVLNLTREMALDYANWGIRINAIAPGVIDTEMTASFLSDENTKKTFLEKIPVGRIGEPIDIAYGALFLASSESDFITGQTIVIDGGWTIR